MVFSCKWFKLAMLLLGTVTELPKTPALFVNEAMEMETNLDGKDEATEERMDNLKNDNLQASEKLGRHKAFNLKQSK